MKKGLPNFGNTCYFNSALQCLLYVPQLTNYFLQKEGSNQFSQEYKKLVYQMWRDEGPCDPRNIIKLVISRFPQFSQGQQDAQELFLCMLDMFQEQEYINAIFKGRLVQETKCSSGTSIKFEDFFSLVMYPTSESITVSQCLEEYQKYQTIIGYTDNNGVTHKISLSRIKFWTIPRVLVICFQGQKNIIIENEINMGPFIHCDSKFPVVTKKLMGLIYHHGTQDFGHYVAFVRQGSTWFYKDDENVKEMEPPKEAKYYMAFYV
jgi:ubiquitin C-terminal hydrolase